jgi:NitT/TauT family transport system substrate-binding protein
MKRRDFLKAATIVSAAALTGIYPLTKAWSAKPTLKIGYLPITDHLTIIAHDQIEFKRFDLEPVKFSSWAEQSEALKAGAIHGAFTLTPIGITLRQKGVPLKTVVAGHRNGSVITVKNGPAISKIDDLKGKTIAIPSRFSTHNILLRKILTEKGIDPDKDVRLIDMAPPEMVNALSTGRIDAFIVAEPFGAQAQNQNQGKVLIFSKDIWKNHICCLLNLREDVIAQSPDAVEELVAGIVKTGHYIEKNPVEAARISKKYLGQKPEVIEFVLTSPKGRVTYNNLAITKKDLQDTQNYMVAFGITKEKIDLNTYLDSRFIPKK